MRRLGWCSCLWLLLLASAMPVQAEPGAPLVGQSEKVYTLAPDNTEVRGLAFDAISPAAPRLFVLDRSGKIFAYQVHQDPQQGIDELKWTETYELPKEADKPLLGSPRGLAFALDNDQSVFYLLNWDNSGAEIKSQLWRCNFDTNTSTPTDLTRYTFRIGQREVLDLACDHGKIMICFDASGYRDNNLRVARGVIQLAHDQAHDGWLEFVRHMPDSGEFVSRGLACMKFEGARYLWATAGNDHIYAAQAQTGRGLFYFDRPKLTEEDRPLWGLAFGQRALWVPESVQGPDRVHRVNVIRNPDAFHQGPRILRHLSMTIETRPERDNANPGAVYHYYSRPYPYDQLHNQGTWPETEKVTDTSAAPNAAVRPFTYDPADDMSSRQHMSLVEYADAPARTYSSKYEIDIWTNDYRKYVYPHRVDRNVNALAGMDYLADDPDLFNLSDTEAYGGFFERVGAHIQAKYHVPPDMENPYWVARNALEYIQDHYYYPSRAQRRPATVDYDRNHYDANPGNLKIALSDRPYDKTQITACSGTSVMLAGALRYWGFPARWLGTGKERGQSLWDHNGNGLLDASESAPCSSGHRYTQVWLGSHYGWICFDATPSRPDFMDYDPVPPLKSQWRYMNRAARGHLVDKRIVFNVGSQLFRPLYRDFEYDERLAIDNNCGGDQRYNLQGRFEKPHLWKLPRHRIAVTNLCFIEDVAVSGPRDKMNLTWKLKGAWDRDPHATLSVYLQRLAPGSDQSHDVTRLAKAIAPDSPHVCVDLSGHEGTRYRIMLRKDGDPATGGCSPPFDLK